MKSSPKFAPLTVEYNVNNEAAARIFKVQIRKPDVSPYVETAIVSNNYQNITEPVIKHKSD